jgi:hypothetical protein
MDKQGNQLNRHLAPLKMVSRLLGHEMHAQGAAKTISLSREEVGEIRTTIDLFIEEASRRTGAPTGAPGSGLLAGDLPTAGESNLVPTRN